MPGKGSAEGLLAAIFNRFSTGEGIMRIVKKSLVFMAVAIAMVSLSSIANAIPQYLTVFQAKYPNTTTITCGVCHTTQNPVTAPNTARNPYGLAFQARRHNTVATRNNALTFIEKLDSDGDGFTNLTEITATTAGIKVLPGFATANAAFPGLRAFEPFRQDCFFSIISATQHSGPSRIGQ